MTPADLDRILRYRRDKERRAAAALSKALDAHAKAVAEWRAAESAAADFAIARRARQAGLYREITGQRLPLRALDRLEAALVEMKERTDQLREQVAAAETAMRDRADGAQKARAAHRQRYRACAKWEDLTLQIAAEAAKRREVLSEVEIEEIAGDRRQRSPEAGR